MVIPNPFCKILGCLEQNEFVEASEFHQTPKRSAGGPQRAWRVGLGDLRRAL